MKTKKEVHDWLLENCVTYGGTLDLSFLDFSDFDDIINIGGMKVKRDLIQDCQHVGGDLVQDAQHVGGHLSQDNEEKSRPDWFARLIAEENDLRLRINGLNHYMIKQHNELGYAKDVFINQLLPMIAYDEALNVRIKNYKEDR